MSVSIEHPAPGSQATRAGQFVAGLIVLFIALAGCWAITLLPWSRFEPLLRWIVAHPLLDAFLRAFVVINFIMLHVLLLIWWERKIAGWMQARLGPMHVGWKGLLQTVADAVKLMTKEDVVPALADKPLFAVAPLLVFLPTVMTFMALPFSALWVGYDYSLSALYVLAVTTVTAIGVMAAGWGSNNKYSLMGGFRAVAQLISYEIPMVVVILAVVTLAGTLSLTGIVDWQAKHGWLLFAGPYVLITIPGFLIFVACALAELNRAPFDLPEAESELVSGFNTEYSGMRFALFFLAEFANNFFSAGLAVTLFLGGWNGPLLPGPMWFVIKTSVIITLLMWIRWTMPRLRMDQMMGLCWKLLVPLSIVLFTAAAVFGK